jgi:Rod binding domain-containing protein
MGTLAIPPIDTTAVPTAGKSDDAARVRDAARQFETLLIGQILHSAHSDGTNWLGAAEDSASDCATDYAEQQLAAVMAQAGGLGLSRLIEQGLQKPPAAPIRPLNWSASR